VVRQRANGTCDVRFDDGDTRDATPLAEMGLPTPFRCR
jgi:hypothetical protein